MPCTMYLAGFKQWTDSNSVDGNNMRSLFVNILIDNLVVYYPNPFKCSGKNVENFIMSEMFRTWGQSRLYCMI